MAKLGAYLKHPVVKVLLVLPFSVLLLYLAFREVELDSFLASFRGANVGWITIAVLISTASFFVRAVRWQQLMNVERRTVSFFDALYGLLFGYFVNLLVPRAGEVGRCTLVAKRTQLPLATTLGTVVTERLIDLISTLIVTLLAVIVSFDRFGSFLWKTVLAPFFASFSSTKVFVLLGLFVGVFLVFLLLFYLLRSGRFGNRLRSWWNEKKAALWAGMQSIVKLKSKWLFVVYTLLLWGCYWLMAYTISLALPATAQLGGAASLAILVVGTFGMIIPAQGGIGSFHLAVVLWLAVEGVARPDALAYATLSHEGQILLYVVFLALCYLFTFVRKRTKSNTDGQGKK